MTMIHHSILQYKCGTVLATMTVPVVKKRKVSFRLWQTCLSVLQHRPCCVSLLQAREGDDMLLRFVAFLGKFTTIEDVQADEAQQQPGPHEGGSQASGKEGHSNGGKGNKEEEGEPKVSEQQANTYRPHIPGRVLYIYR